MQLLILCEKCPNAELFLVSIFPHSDWIRTRNNVIFGHFSRSVKFVHSVSVPRSGLLDLSGKNHSPMNSTVTNKIKHFPQLFSLGPQMVLLLSFQINHYHQNRYTFISIKIIVFARINCKLSACHNKNLIVFYAQNKPLPATNVHAIA